VNWRDQARFPVLISRTGPNSTVSARGAAWAWGMPGTLGGESVRCRDQGATVGRV